MARKLLVEVAGDTRQYERSLQRAAKDTSRFNQQIGKMGRGAAAGSGAFRSLGRSLAFASGGFLAAASITDVLRDSIAQASEAAVAQKQLAAQFKASGQNLADYQAQIDRTINSLSNLAGIEDDQVRQAFTLAFRATQDVEKGLRITTIAADVAKGRHVELAQATLALNKAFAGQTTALKRLGIVVPQNLKGMAALEFVARRFAGQAQAGTTSQERFNAALANMEEAIGKALLPTFEKLLDDMGKWLGNAENQKKVQEDVEAVVRTSAKAFGLLAEAIRDTASAYKFLSGIKGPSLMDLVGHLPGGNKSLLEILGLRGGGGGKPLPRGQSPIGENALGGRLITPTAAAATPAAAGPAGFRARMAKLAIQMAKAEMTQAQKDDRAVLVEMAALIKQRIGRVKTLKERRELYEQLASVSQQISAIDEQQRQQEEAARQKQLDAQKKAADAAKAHAAKIKAAMERQKDALKAAADTVIDQMELFDVFVPDDPAKGILGVTGGKLSARSLTARLKTQTDQAVKFNNDLARLARRGAPPSLIASLRAQGLAGGANVHALATAGRGDLNAFLRQYARRQRVAQQIAHADIQAKTVVIHAGSIRQSATSPSSQRRGRQAGVIAAATAAGTGSPW